MSMVKAAVQSNDADDDDPLRVESQTSLCASAPGTAYGAAQHFPAAFAASRRSS